MVGIKVVANVARWLPPAVQISGKMAATLANMAAMLANMATMVECPLMKGMEEGHDDCRGRTQPLRWPPLPHGRPP